jgi:DNA-binding NtrC family response regulator
MQDRQFMPVGSAELMTVDVRIIAATNADLKRMVDEGKFREDLYYRLDVIKVPLPPLRERKEDIPLLVAHFFQKFCRENEKFLDSQGNSLLSFDSDAMQVLLDHNWPGNIRELENAVERAAVLATQQVVTVDLLPEHLLQEKGIRIRRDEHGQLPADASLGEIVADFERRKIIEQLERSNWSQTDAAEALRLPLSTLNQKIKRLNIDVRRRAEIARSDRG